MSFLYNEELGRLILRLTVGGLMLFHGVAKILHTGTIDFISGRLVETGLPGMIAYGVYAGEVLAPVMLILGIYCRAGAALIVVNMLFAIGLSHMADITALTDHGGWRLELQGFYLFGALAVMFLGSGRIAARPD
jgi:putative oxidoreductase